MITIYVFGYPFRLYAKEGVCRLLSLRVDTPTLKLILSNIEHKLRSFSKIATINRRVNEFSIVPNPAYLRNEGYEIIGYNVPCKDDTFIDNNGLITRNSVLEIDKPYWILRPIVSEQANVISEKEMQKEILKHDEFVI